MRRYYLDAAGKPIIWPRPADCLWKYGRLETSGALFVEAGDFPAEARLLAGMLAETGVVREAPGAPAVRLGRDGGLAGEAYRLEVTEMGIRIAAGTPEGAFRGCTALLQMLRNSFDDSVACADVADGPSMPFRGVKVPFPAAADLPRFRRFTGFIARYHANRLLLDIGGEKELAGLLRDRQGEARELAAFLAVRHIGVVPFLRLQSAQEPGLEQAVSLFGAGLVAVDVARPAGCMDDAAAAKAFADLVCALHARLKAAGAALALVSAPLHPVTGGRAVSHDEAARRNAVLPATCGAVGMIPRDILILDVNHTGDRDSAAFFAAQGFRTVYGGCEGVPSGWAGGCSQPSAQGAYAAVGGIDAASLSSGGNRLAAVLRVLGMAWRAERNQDGTARGLLLTLEEEKTIAALYPPERDLLEERQYPSAGNPGYHAVDLRGRYNSPLQHSYWRVDDHFMMFLQDAMTLPNSIPFSLFQGVLDFQFQNAFVMAGGSWNAGVPGISVGRKAQSVAFLHAYIFGKQQFIAGMDGYDGKTVGQYAIRYADGTESRVDIVLGRDIAFWKNYRGTNQGAYEANPALTGISPQGLHYTIYAREWVNPRPDEEIASIDVLPCAELDGRIALFGVTLVDREGAGI